MKSDYMFYTYILYSQKSHDFYVGCTDNLTKRFKRHNSGQVRSTRPYVPWKIVFYAAFDKKEIAEMFEKYLKSGSGRSFLYKRLVDSVALKKDKLSARTRHSEAPQGA